MKEVVKTDILIIGTGLAGLRAAYSALKEDPNITITLISADNLWKGSSFCNMYGALGMQVLENDIDKEFFLNRAKDISYPGILDEDLCSMMLEHSYNRFLELLEIGVKFRKDSLNKIIKTTGCFLPEKNTAVIIEDMKHTFNIFYKKLKGNVKFLEYMCLLNIIVDNSNQSVEGAIFYNFLKKEIVGIKARCIICAFGGWASIFPWTCAWKNSYTGYGLAIFKQAGVKLVNIEFIQMLWFRIKDFSFFSFEEFLKKNVFVKKGSTIQKLSFCSKPLIKNRLTHCPIAYNGKDFLLDKFLLEAMEDDGVELRAEKKSFYIVPVSQSSNGGAYIDKNSMTNIYGLFACGECASGMHGANRIGGAMILSSQVFGHIAGKEAVKLSKEKSFLSDKLFTNLINEYNFFVQQKVFNSQGKWLDNNIRFWILFIKGLFLGSGDEIKVYKWFFSHDYDNACNIFTRLKNETIKEILFKILNINSNS